MKIIRTTRDLRKHVAALRTDGASLALVPTMGALHDGHLALVKLAQKKAGRVVVSIFVNPTQFAAHEDLSRYPRDEDGDVAKLRTAGVDAVWAPPVSEMYPSGFVTQIDPKGAALGLEGDVRPHHFGGVATVCAKLFNQVTPDVAIFGEKDYQQLCVIRQLVRDLDMTVKIVGLPTVREKDGLAKSSRNRYLSEAERPKAPALFQALNFVADGVQRIAARKRRSSDMAANLKVLCDGATDQLITAGFKSVDYIAVRDAITLAPLTELGPETNARVLAAAWLGNTRLIDNVAVA